MSVYLGLDLGSKTLGIAVSHSGIIASPLETYRFKEHDYDMAIRYLNKLIQEFSVKHVILGLPKHMNNDMGDRAQLSIQFQEKLKDVEVILWDERLSTKSAMDSMRIFGLSSQEKKAQKDTQAALIILQNYLNYKENQHGR